MNFKEPDHRDQEISVRILQAAEVVFADKGPEKATLREITTRADVNLAAVSYYFGSKAVLTRAVFDQLSTRLNDLRTNDLEICLAKAAEAKKAPDLRTVLEIFVRPYVETGKSGQLFARLIMQHRVAPSELTSAIIKNHFDPMAKRFIAAITLACPGMDSTEFFWRYVFMIGAVVYSVADMGVAARAASLSGGKLDAHDPVAFRRALLTFLLGGMSAVASEESSPLRRSRPKRSRAS
ncbi:AcrR family transcriptional regulator [Tardiphaga robiniae]|uniref:TetR/AcrR family transcriptional regulator n=1 Tax=Tardiphaga robiniae TaxID=943830 RepID=UPI0028564161|nr:TetR/AcrR family transcriptional regulator [Tardiphaga robiniae]MDR6660826.1 AcrR family transcriptional regulator [Tardiphaga robiniae]